MDEQASNLRSTQILLGHANIESMARYLEGDVEGALEFTEATED